MPALSKGPKKYQLKPVFLVLQDEQSVKFHIKNDDYFGTIATILSLLKQEIKKCRQDSQQITDTFKNLEKDLLYLQKNYQINPKINQKKTKPKGRLKSQ